MNHRILVFALIIAQASAIGFAAEGPTIEWQVFNSEDGVGDDCWKFFEDFEGNIWCAGATGGVSKFDGTRWTNLREGSSFKTPAIPKYYADSRGNVWFFHLASGRFSKYDGRQLITAPRSWGAYSIFEDSKGKLWLGSRGQLKGKRTGVLRYADADEDLDNFVRFSKKEDGLAGNVMHVIFEDSNNILWIGTEGGVSAYDGSTWTTYNKKNGLTSELVTAILEDKEGNVWVGTYGGLFRYDGSLQSDAASEERTGARKGGPTAYLGRPFRKRSKGVEPSTMPPAGSWRRFSKEDGTLPTNDVLFLKMDSGGNIWVGVGGHVGGGLGLIGAFSDLAHKSGVLKFDGEEWVEFSGEGGSPPVKVIKLEIDSRDNIWCDSFTTGIYRYDGETWTKLSKEEGFYANHFSDFEEDSQGNIWLATGSGLLFFDGADWTHYSIGNGGLFAENVYSVFEDSRGDIWIQTGKGVGRYRR